jgi:hypothetical protein
MQTINIVRHYNIVLTKFQNKIYKDDPTWIAIWFFNNNIMYDNVTFEIQGNMHNTFPNPEHLSVRVIYENGYTSEWLHLSKDENGDGYMQPLDIAMGNKSKKNGKKNGKKNDKKNDKNRLKKLQTLRKKNK